MPCVGLCIWALFAPPVLAQDTAEQAAACTELDEQREKKAKKRLWRENRRAAIVAALETVPETEPSEGNADSLKAKKKHLNTAIETLDKEIEKGDRNLERLEARYRKLKCPDLTE